MCRPSTVTRPHSVLTEGLTLSRSIWEMRLGETPTRLAISRTVSPLRWRSARRRAPMREGSGSSGYSSAGVAAATADSLVRGGHGGGAAQLLGEVLPVALEAVRVAVGRPGRRGLQPQHL